MYEDQTYEAILQRTLARVSGKFDKREGSVIWDTHSPAAIEFQNLYLELTSILKEAYGDTASRQYLISRCKERGIIPHPATYAILKGIFSPATVDVTGKRFSLDALNYTVLERIAGEEYKVQCEVAGKIGTQYFGTLIPIDYMDSLASAELVEVLIPGEDEEETEHLRERYFNSFDDAAFGGNVRDYIIKVKAISGVGGCKVTRVWNGDISPADLIPSDAVKAWYAATVGGLSQEVKAWLMSVYNAALEKKLTIGGTVKITIIDSDFNVPTNTLIDSVQTALDPEQNAGEGYGIAPIGHVVNVKPVNAVSIYIKSNVTFDTGYSWSNMRAAIETVINGYFGELREAWADSPFLVIRVSQIETRILALTGIVDIQDTKLNGIGANLNLGAFEVPVLGSVGA